jgi:hypothetical protein
MILHANDSVHFGLLEVLMTTTDTVALVLVIDHFQKTVDCAWVGKNLRYIATHDIANFLGPGKARVLLVTHAFTGCDTVSIFGGFWWDVKKTIWTLGNAFSEATRAFLATVDR